MRAPTLSQILFILSLFISLGKSEHPDYDSAFESYQSFWKEDDDPPTIVTLSKKKSKFPFYTVWQHKLPIRHWKKRQRSLNNSSRTENVSA